MVFQAKNGEVVPRNNCRWNEKKARFVEAYLECGEGARAARMAGYSQKAAKEQAWRLLNVDAKVMAAIEQGRQALRERNEITVDAMVQQFDQDREFAVETKNATAAVRASELKAKLAGLLVDRVKQRTVGGLKIELVQYDST